MVADVVDFEVGMADGVDFVVADMVDFAVGVADVIDFDVNVVDFEIGVVDVVDFAIGVVDFKVGVADVTELEVEVADMVDSTSFFHRQTRAYVVRRIYTKKKKKVQQKYISIDLALFLDILVTRRSTQCRYRPSNPCPLQDGDRHRDTVELEKKKAMKTTNMESEKKKVSTHQFKKNTT